jgi:hypothetical protein
MSRREELEERRRELLIRCDEQRGELAYRLEQLRPSAQVARWTQGAPARAMSNPLAWIAALAGIVALLRPRRLLSWFSFAAGAMAVVSRATALVRLVATLRSSLR